MCTRLYFLQQFLLIPGILLACVVRGQMQGPPLPQYPTLEPITADRSHPGFTPNNNYGATSLPNNNRQVHMGGTAADVMRQVNSNNPWYREPGDTRTNQQMSNDRMMAEMAKDPAYNPGLRNGTATNFPLSHLEEVKTLLEEADMLEDPAASVQKLNTDYYKTPAFAQQSKGYTVALAQLKNMLSGKQRLSLATAYFITEHAYGNSYLTAKEFQSILGKSADFIGDWMKQNTMNAHDQEDVHLAIQKFMSGSLTITRQRITTDKQVHLQTITHMPFFYDYNDYQGEKDYRNYFVTKCLATGGGQCSSLPIVYLVLAEALGVPAYLTTAPQHSFIKYRDNKGVVVNYEPTSNWRMSDNWYQDNMFITATAKRNHVYLDTFNKRQIVADCILSLAFGYMKKFGAADGSFVMDCLNTVNKAFVYDNIRARFIYGSLTARLLNATMVHAGMNRYSDIARSPEAQRLYRALEENELRITELGYKPEPTDMYNELLKQHEFKGKVQDSLHIDGKRTRNLFIESE